MPFWQSSTPANERQSVADPRQSQGHVAQVDVAQAALTKARRNLIGALVLLLGAVLLVPWVLDKKPRAWGDDVILNMPKSTAPLQKTQVAPSAAEGSAAPTPIDSTSPLKPSQPLAAPAGAETLPPVSPASGKGAP